MRFLAWASAGVLVIIIHNVNTNVLDSAANLFRAFKSDQRKMTTKSSLHCLQNCVRRSGCKFAGFLSYLGTCTMDLSPGHSSHMVKDNRKCEVADAYIQEIPKKLGGACEDHKCDKKMVCIPQTGGGYRCVKDTRRAYS